MTGMPRPQQRCLLLCPLLLQLATFSAVACVHQQCSLRECLSCSYPGVRPGDLISALAEYQLAFSMSKIYGAAAEIYCQDVMAALLWCLADAHALS